MANDSAKCLTKSLAIGLLVVAMEIAAVGGGGGGVVVVCRLS